MRKKLTTFALAALSVLVLSVTAYAADTAFSVTDVISTGVSDIVAQLMAIIGIVAAAIMGFLIAKIGLTKGISLFRSLVGRA